MVNSAAQTILITFCPTNYLAKH